MAKSNFEMEVIAITLLFTKCCSAFVLVIMQMEGISNPSNEQNKKAFAPRLSNTHGS